MQSFLDAMLSAILPVPLTAYGSAGTEQDDWEFKIF